MMRTPAARTGAQRLFRAGTLFGSGVAAGMSAYHVQQQDDTLTQCAGVAVASLEQFRANRFQRFLKAYAEQMRSEENKKGLLEMVEKSEGNCSRRLDLLSQYLGTVQADSAALQKLRLNHEVADRGDKTERSLERLEDIASKMGQNELNCFELRDFVLIVARCPQSETRNRLALDLVKRFDGSLKSHEEAQKNMQQKLEETRVSLFPDADKEEIGTALRVLWRQSTYGPVPKEFEKARAELALDAVLPKIKIVSFKRQPSCDYSWYYIAGTAGLIAASLGLYRYTIDPTFGDGAKDAAVHAGKRAGNGVLYLGEGAHSGLQYLGSATKDGAVFLGQHTLPPCRYVGSAVWKAGGGTLNIVHDYFWVHVEDAWDSVEDRYHMKQRTMELGGVAIMPLCNGFAHSRDTLGFVVSRVVRLVGSVVGRRSHSEDFEEWWNKVETDGDISS